jgi:hypothetical protein
MKRASIAGCVVVACALGWPVSSTASAPTESTGSTGSTALLGVSGQGVSALRARLRDRLREQLRQGTPDGPRDPAVSPGAALLLDDDTQHLRLRGPAGVAVDVMSVRAQLAEAEAAFRALEHERSVALLETAIEALQADRDFSVDKQELLEQARLTCAQRLVGLAGPTETGKAETHNGRRARQHLAGVLRSNPAFTLDARRYPPKLRALLALATDDVKQAGLGSLTVRSVEPGAVVRVDGRRIGSTPLSLHEGLPAGRFRLWLEAGGLRSFTRVVDVAAGADILVEVDVAFEAALRPDELGVSPSRPLSSADWRRVAGLLDVDRVAVVGMQPGTPPAAAAGTVVWAAVVDGRTGRVLRGLRVPSPGGLDDAGVERVVGLWAGQGGDADFVPPVDVFAPAIEAPSSPASPARSATSGVGDDDGGFPWLGVGIGVGAAGVVAAVTAGVLLQATKTTTETFSVTVAEPTR